MFRKLTLNQEFADNLKDDAKNLLWAILAAIAMGAPVTYLIYRPFM